MLLARTKIKRHRIKAGDVNVFVIHTNLIKDKRAESHTYIQTINQNLSKNVFHSVRRDGYNSAIEYKTFVRRNISSYLTSSLFHSAVKIV